jgi:hypothetical protein
MNDDAGHGRRSLHLLEPLDRERFCFFFGAFLIPRQKPPRLMSENVMSHFMKAGMKSLLI